MGIFTDAIVNCIGYMYHIFRSKSFRDGKDSEIISRE